MRTRPRPSTRAATLFAAVIFFMSVHVGAVHGPGLRTGIAHAEPPDLASLSDEFDDHASKSQWQRFCDAEGWPDMLARFNIDGSRDGFMVVEPQVTMWNADFHGPLVFKEIEGDFVVTTWMRTEGLTVAVPMQRWSMGGLMARSPRDVGPDTWVPGNENWLIMSYGYANRSRRADFEVKNTINSETSRDYIEAVWNPAEVGMARVGSAFILFCRTEGNPWRIAARLWREDLPPRLQVGVTAYTAWLTAMPLHRDPVAFNSAVYEEGHPDLAVYLDYVRFQSPAIPAGIDAKSLVTDEVKEKDLLDWLIGSETP